MSVLTSLIQINTVGSIENLSEQDVFDLLTHADDQYYNAEDPIMADAAYDLLYKQSKSTYPANEYFTGIGSTVRGGKIKLPFTMGSLDQIYLGEYDKWITHHPVSSEQLVVSHKLDGCSAMIVYGGRGELQIAYSRGDGQEGADITRHLIQMPSVPTNCGGAVIVRGEVIISKDIFTKEIQSRLMTRSGRPYKNARNCVAGLLNASSNPLWVYQHLTFVAYEIVQS